MKRFRSDKKNIKYLSNTSQKQLLFKRTTLEVKSREIDHYLNRSQGVQQITILHILSSDQEEASSISHSFSKDDIAHKILELRRPNLKKKLHKERYQLWLYICFSESCEQAATQIPAFHHLYLLSVCRLIPHQEFSSSKPATFPQLDELMLPLLP